MAPETGTPFLSQINSPRFVTARRQGSLLLAYGVYHLLGLGGVVY
jgi:hypothetical protein